MKIYLFNDTLNLVHSGSDAIMRSIYAKIPDSQSVIGVHKVNSYSYDEDIFEECDAVLVNGEGTIHHSAPPGNFLMEVLRTAQKKKKRTYLINTIFQQKPPYYGDVLQNLNYLSVRDPYSFRCAEQCGAVPKLFIDLCADTMFLNSGQVLEHYHDRILVGDGHRQAKFFSFPFFISVKKELKKLPYLRFYLEGRFEDLIQTLKTAKLYITGQYHGMYCAGLAGIPFIVMPSNSFKIEALIDWSKLPIRICKRNTEVEKTISWALRNRSIFSEFREFILSQPSMDKKEFEYMFRS